ncbi:Hypothetical protein D9617_23g005650 [Elsinoe fawcettii]|nr:Hypothetical protein D9617_23g005650 [Elsinoe fawcettii]
MKATYPSFGKLELFSPLPFEVQMMIADPLLEEHPAPTVLAGVTGGASPRFALPGDCLSYQREHDSLPAICRVDGPISDAPMTHFLRSHRNEFTLHLTNFDAHSLEHAIKAMEVWRIRSNGRLGNVEVYFYNCGRHMVLSNLVKWSIFYRTFADYLSPEVHFSAPFCNENHGNIADENDLLRRIARETLRVAQDDGNMINSLRSLISSFVALTDINVTANHSRYEGLRRYAQCNASSGIVRLQWLHLDPAMNKEWQDAWGQHCTLRSLPGPWDLVPRTECTDYYRVRTSDELPRQDSGQA